MASDKNISASSVSQIKGHTLLIDSITEAILKETNSVRKVELLFKKNKHLEAVAHYYKQLISRGFSAHDLYELTLFQINDGLKQIMDILMEVNPEEPKEPPIEGGQRI